ncbi:MAG: hypothetical protein N2112_05535 [Gemmataceae bacterium]|jgi:hypothetical protein|nr:hypothetical protein [Gemmataceae bacterium]
MAKHEVMFSIPERQLGKADVQFSIKRDGKAFGRLKVSNGTSVWVPKDQTYGYKMTWVEFDQLMNDRGTPEKS